MILELKLAARFSPMRRRGLIRFTAFAAIAGIAAGVAALIVSQAVARGFQSEMQDKILANTPHISVFRNDGGELVDWRKIQEALAKIENVKTVAPGRYQSALIAGPLSTAYAFLRVHDNGDGDNAGKIEVMLGAELAQATGIASGSDAEIITLGDGESPKNTTVRVAGIFNTGLYDYDSTGITISAKDFARLSGQLDFVPTTLVITVRDIYRSNETAGDMRNLLGEEFRVLDWQEANRPLFAALSLERRAALAIISLIILVAALNITTTLALLVNERRFDIAVLKTCGAKAKSLISLFLLEGLFLGLIGIISGVIVGLVLCYTGNYFKALRLSAEVYSLSYIPLRPAAADVLWISGGALCICLLATLYPAVQSIRVKPIENLRT